eukprot:5149759-Ditylum_brightwellii.AAC.1
MQRTGWFKDGIRVWNTRDAGDKTWQSLKKIAKEYDEIKEEQEVTAQAAGYTQANNAIKISKDWITWQMLLCLIERQWKTSAKQTRNRLRQRSNLPAKWNRSTKNLHLSPS